MTLSDTLLDMITALDRRLQTASPQEIVAEAIRSFPKKRLAYASSFGAESGAMLALIANVDRSVPILFLDTGWLFDETLKYRDQLVAKLGLTDVRTIKPDPRHLAEADPSRDLFQKNPDACCNLRKVEPLANALEGFTAWINGRKRYHGGERSDLPVVELDGKRLKFNPFAYAKREDIRAIFEQAGLPRHPLAAAGFTSIGCMPCTALAASSAEVRAGRWQGLEKTECGIHSPRRDSVPVEAPANFAGAGCG